MMLQMHNATTETQVSRVLARPRVSALKHLGLPVTANPATCVFIGTGTVDAYPYRRPRNE
jgi:hypothetical protein